VTLALRGGIDGDEGQVPERALGMKSIHLFEHAHGIRQDRGLSMLLHDRTETLDVRLDARRQPQRRATKTLDHVRRAGRKCAPAERAHQLWHDRQISLSASQRPARHRIRAERQHHHAFNLRLFFGRSNTHR
jgi:hypothetical protein